MQVQCLRDRASEYGPGHQAPPVRGRPERPDQAQALPDDRGPGDLDVRLRELIVGDLKMRLTRLVWERVVWARNPFQWGLVHGDGEAVQRLCREWDTRKVLILRELFEVWALLTPDSASDELLTRAMDLLDGSAP